jgi:hypothetical protein
MTVNTSKEEKTPEFLKNIVKINNEENAKNTFKN